MKRKLIYILLVFMVLQNIIFANINIVAKATNSMSVAINLPDDIPGWKDGYRVAYDNALSNPQLKDFVLRDNTDPMGFNDNTSKGNSTFGQVNSGKYAQMHQNIEKHYPRNENILQWSYDVKDQTVDSTKVKNWDWGKDGYFYIDDYNKARSLETTLQEGIIKSKTYNVNASINGVSVPLKVNGSKISGQTPVYKNWRKFPDNPNVDFYSSQSLWTKHPSTALLQKDNVKQMFGDFLAYYCYDYTIHYTVNVKVYLGSLTIHYKDQDTGKTLLEDNQVSNLYFSEGTSRKINDSDVGSNLKPNSLQYNGNTYNSVLSDVNYPTLTESDSSGEITLYYKAPTPGTLTLRYLDKATGDKIHESSSVVETLPHTVTASELLPYEIPITEYTYDSYNPSTLPALSESNGLETVTLLYNKIPSPPPPAGKGTLTIRYVDKDSGDSIRPEDSLTMDLPHTFTEADISDKKLSIEGYTYSGYTPTTLPTIDDNNKTANLVMQYDKYKVVIPTPNLPPIAAINMPGSAYEGNAITVTSASTDPDGDSSKLENAWKNNADTDNLGTNKSGSLVYNNQGEYTVGLTVTDERGATDSTSKDIIILPATPTASFSITGSLKQNRKVTIKSTSKSMSTGFPIITSKNEWSILPLTEGIAASDIKYSSTNNTDIVKDVLFKKPGSYRVSHRVRNSKYTSDWYTEDITIESDLPPVADFNTAAKVYRDPNNNNIATAYVYDASHSDDGDTIASRKLEYRFDSNNDGSFDDEAWTVFDTTNLTKWSVPLNKIGKYQFRLTVQEDFGQPTLDEFISSDDKLSDDSSNLPVAQTITEVDNVPPYISFSMLNKSSINVDVLTDYSGSNLSSLITSLNTMKSTLGSSGINVNLNLVDSTQNVLSGTIKPIFKDRVVTILNNGDVYYHFSTYNMGPITEYIGNFPGAYGAQEDPLDSYSAELEIFAKDGSTNNVYWYTYRNNDDYYLGTSSMTYKDKFIGYKKIYFSGGFYVELDSNNHLRGSSSLNLNANLNVSDIGQIYTCRYQANSGHITVNTYVTYSTGGTLYQGITSFFDGVQTGNATYSPVAYGVAMFCQTGTSYFYVSNYSSGVIFPGQIGDNAGIVNVPGYMLTDTATVLQPYNSTNVVAMYGSYFGAGGGWPDFPHSICVLKLSNGNYYVIDATTSTTLVRVASGWVYGASYAQAKLDFLKTAVVWNFDIYNPYYIVAVNAQNQITQQDVITRANWASPDTWGNPSWTSTMSRTAIFPQQSGYDPCLNQMYSLNIVFTDGSYYSHYDATYNSIPQPEIDPLTNNIYSINSKGVGNSPPSGTNYLLYVSNSQPNMTLSNGFGNYFSFNDLNKAFVNKLVANNYNIYASCPISTYDYINNMTGTQELTIRQMVKSSALDNGLYDTGQYQTAIQDIEIKCILKKLTDSGVTIKNVGLDVASDYTGSKLIDLQTKINDLKLNVAQNGVNLTTNIIGGGLYVTGNGYNAVDLSLGGNFPAVQDNYFLGVSDGLGAITTYPYGEYFSFGSLSTSFSQKLYLNNYSSAFVTPPANWDFTLPQSPSDNITMREITKNSVIPFGSVVDNLYDLGALQTALNDIQSSIITSGLNSGAFTKYVLLNDEVSYSWQYGDYESDPQNALRWMYTHNPSGFDNNQGTIADSGQWTTEKDSFNHVGAYLIDLQAQDNPTKGDSKFANYDYWSQSLDTLNKLVVHRAPIPAFTVLLTPNVTRTQYGTQIINASYDLDHISYADKGIKTLSWKWKNITDTMWSTGSLPATLPSNNDYLLSISVTDYEGVTSVLTKAVSTQNSNSVPTVTLSPTSRDWANTNANVIITAADTTNPITSIMCQWTNSTSMPTSGWVETDYTNNFVTQYQSASQSNEGVWYLYTMAVNKLGMTAYSRGGPYKIDKTAPNALSPISSTATYRKGNDLWIAGGQSATITARWNDDLSGNSLIYIMARKNGADYSGSYQDTSQGVSDKSTSYYQQGDLTCVSAIRTAHSIPGETDVSFQYNASVGAAENDYPIYLDATDNAGNKFSTQNSNTLLDTTLKVRIDTTAPTIGLDVTGGNIQASSVINCVTNDARSGLKETWYMWSSSNAAINTFAGFTKLIGTQIVPPNVDGIYYLHVKSIDNVGNVNYSIFGSYTISSLTIAAVVTPNPAMQGQKITFTISTTGNAKILTVYFPNDIYLLDPLSSPISVQIPEQTNRTDTITYYLPLKTPVTLDEGNVRVLPAYTLQVKAQKADGTTKIANVLLDVKGNIFNGLKTEIKKN